MNSRTNDVKSRQSAERQAARKRVYYNRPEHRAPTSEERAKFEASVLRGIGGFRL